MKDRFQRHRTFQRPHRNGLSWSKAVAVVLTLSGAYRVQASRYRMRYGRSRRRELVGGSPSSKAKFGLIWDPILARLCPGRGVRTSINLLILNIYEQPSRRTVNGTCARCMTGTLTSWRKSSLPRWLWRSPIADIFTIRRICRTPGCEQLQLERRQLSCRNQL